MNHNDSLFRSARNNHRLGACCWPKLCKCNKNLGQACVTTPHANVKITKTRLLVRDTSLIQSPNNSNLYVQSLKLCSMTQFLILGLVTVVDNFPSLWHKIHSVTRLHLSNNKNSLITKISLKKAYLDMFTCYFLNVS